MSIMSIHKLKRLFARWQYPIHYAWLDLIEKSLSNSDEQEHLSNEARYVSEIMGDKYVDALELILNSDSQLQYTLLPLKVSAKKCKTSNGEEFEKNCDKIKLTLSKYVSIKTPAEQNLEQRKIQEQRHLARREASEKMFKEMKAKREMESKKRKLEYDKNYVDFPAIEMIKIRRRSKAAKIFKTLIGGKVIPESDYLWLVNNDFNNQQVRAVYYLNRAKLARREWVDTKKPWNLVNAIADYRKAGKSRIAVDLVGENFPFNFANGNNNLKSALLTTSGGVKRDLEMYDEAIQLGTQAHELTPKDYRPCTLIGACKMLLGDITQGHQWYQKAIKRGFNEDSFEQELRSIYNRATQKDKAKIKQTLIQDGWSYKWLK